MIWPYVLFVGSFVLAVTEGANPLTHPGVWLFGVIIIIHQLVRSRAASQENAVRVGLPSDSPSIGPSSGGTRADSEMDMFHGLRGWNEGECHADVATAACSLSGRGDAYVRSLLVVASLRDDYSGRVVAAAARRLLLRTAAAK